MSLNSEYREYFVRELHDALSGHHSSTVEEAVRYSEQSDTKCVGLTIETRPDHCSNEQIHDMLTYGCTRLEIGVQVLLIFYLSFRLFIMIFSSSLIVVMMQKKLLIASIVFETLDLKLLPILCQIFLKWELNVICLFIFNNFSLDNHFLSFLRVLSFVQMA